MKHFGKYLLTFGLTLSLLCYSVPPAKANVAGDALLLAQQVAQFIQDLSFDTKKWNDIRERLQQVDNIAKTITKGKQAYTSINNIINTEKQICRTAQHLESYISYISEFGDNYRIDRAYVIYRQFMRRSDDMRTDINKTIQSFDLLTDLKPLELLTAMDEATSKLSEYVSSLSEDAITDLSLLYAEVCSQQLVESNQNFLNLHII